MLESTRTIDSVVTRIIDPARFEIVKNALLSTVEEMKIVLAKTAYSPLLKVAGDYSCGIFDAQGNMVAQGNDLPIHLGSMPDAVRAIIKAFLAVHPGEVFIHNDPYQGGSHLPDVNVIMPIFFEGTLLGFSAVRAHWPDVGSATPGSYGAVTEIYGEGLRLPPTKLYVDGKIDRGVEGIIFANVRMPDERRGDLRAQVAANSRANARLQVLCRKYGAGEILQIMDAMLVYSETMMRAAIRGLPDGEASFVDELDGDGIVAGDSAFDEPFTVKVRIVKSGDILTVDFEGSSGRVAGPMNSPLSVTKSGVYCALKMIIDPSNQIPPNSGAWRAIEIKAPPGSVVNAAAPAPVVYANHEMSHRIADMIFAAMHQITPGNVMAGSQGTAGITIFGGTDFRTNEPYVSYEAIKGGMGARPTKDGINAVTTTIGNMMNTPIEVLEMSFPLRVEEYALRVDSGGAGTWRGGLGVKRSWRILKRESFVTVCCERKVTPPFGLSGGAPGASARITLISPNGERQDLNSKGNFVARAGALVVVEVPGSGGFGPPRLRERQRVLDDLADGYISEESAFLDYGLIPGSHHARMT
jgi:N-methylhydantoinase B